MDVSKLNVRGEVESGFGGDGHCDHVFGHGDDCLGRCELDCDVELWVDVSRQIHVVAVNVEGQRLTV